MTGKYTLIASLLVFIIVRLLFIPYNFWGLEYEDSFIYFDNALNIENNIHNPENLFQCISCDIGSYKDCISYMSYGAHYKTFSYVVFILNKLLGSQFINIYVVSFISSGLILVAFFLFEKGIFDRIIFTLILFLTPFYPLFATSGNSEIFSSLWVFLSCVFTIHFVQQGKIKYFIYFLISAGVASISNRENFVLYIIFLIVNIVYQYKIGLPSIMNILIVCGNAIGLAIIVGVFKTEEEYSADIGAPTFSIDYLIDNSIAILKAAFSWDLWGATGILLIIALTTFFFYNKKNRDLKIILVFLVFYYLITFTHYRHFNYLQTGIVKPFETLRYTSTFFPLLAFFMSYNLLTAYRLYKGKLICVVLLLLLGASIYQTYQTRLNFSNDELFSRVQPAQEILKFYKEGDLLVSEFPIVIKNYAHQKTMVADLRSLDNVKVDLFNEIYILVGDHYEMELLNKYSFVHIKKINNYKILKLVK